MKGLSLATVTSIPNYQVEQRENEIYATTNETIIIDKYTTGRQILPIPEEYIQKIPVKIWVQIQTDKIPFKTINIIITKRDNTPIRLPHSNSTNTCWGQATSKRVINKSEDLKKYTEDYIELMRTMNTDSAYSSDAEIEIVLDYLVLTHRFMFAQEDNIDPHTSEQELLDYNNRIRKYEEKIANCAVYTNKYKNQRGELKNVLE